MADEPGSWTVTYELSAKSDVSINPKRLFHGPAALVAPNGDWLVCYQDSKTHAGQDSVISQVRSRNEGRTWKPEGIVFDQRSQKYYGRNPAYGVTSDGLIVLVVQRWRPPPSNVKFPLKAQRIHGSVYLISEDNGKTYSNQGLVDPEVPLRHQGTTDVILHHQNTLMMTAMSVNEPPTGITLYTTQDPRKGWQFAGWIFRADQLPVKEVYYGSMVRRGDGSLLAQCVYFTRNFQSVSDDNGKTWSTPRELKDLRIRNNPDLDYAGDVLVVHGRGAGHNSMVVYFSPDEGRTWGRRIVLDYHGFRGGGGYSASLRTKKGDLFIVFSTDAGPNTAIIDGFPDIRGVLLSDVGIRRK